MHSTSDFIVMGAYPNGREPDLQIGDAVDYQKVQRRSYDVSIPDTDPLNKEKGAVQKYWGKPKETVG